jgi:cryptochrome
MSEMGYGEASTTIHGGTTEAHKCLDAFLADTLHVATFSKPSTAPTSLEPSTTLLSPYMKFGCVGVREIWWGSKRVIEQWKKLGSKGGKETKEPENMFGQLQFRDMYACAEAAGEHFERIRGNGVVR